MDFTGCKKILVGLVLLLKSSSLNVQNYKVRGFFTNVKGDGLPVVHVILNDTSKGTY